MTYKITRDQKLHEVEVKDNVNDPRQFYRYQAICTCGWSSRNQQLEQLDREVYLHKEIKRQPVL